MQAHNQLLPKIESPQRKESTKMASVNVLNQMAEYDFNSPINVTMIFEDSDDEIDTDSFENVREPEIIQANNNNNNNKKETFSEEHVSDCLQVNKNKCKSYCLNKNNKIHKNKTKITEINKNVLGKIVNNNTNIDKIRENIKNVEDQHNANKSVSNLHSCVVRNEVRENTESNENTVQTFVEDLLDKLSENLLMIMQSFYYYEMKNKRSGPVVEEDYHKMKKAFRFIKSHFFEVSYTTVESIILPLEQNATLINQFLDNTMMIAKIKFLKWTFQRHHVQALFDELVIWAKQKQAQIKTIKQTPNGNFNLRQHLTRPPPPYPAQSLNNAPYTKNVTAPSKNTQNGMWCIFRSGAPGSQISINVNPDTLLSCDKTHNTLEWTENRNNFASSAEFPTRNRSKAPPSYDSYYSYCHQPSPHLNQNTVHANQNQMQNRYIIGQQHQHRQDERHPIQNNYRTQVPYANVNRTPQFGSDFINPLRYDCINVNNEMHETEAEQRISSLPVITNVTSVNPKAYTNVRCCMCGKMTEPRYYAFSHSPARPTYCSNLCQELDNQIRNNMCSST